MTVRTWSLMSISIFVAACCLALPFVPRSSAPFDTRPLPDLRGSEILPSSLGLPLPAGIESGDRLQYSDQPWDTRLVMVYGTGNPPAGTTLTLNLLRGTQRLTATGPLVPVPQTPLIVAIIFGLSALNALLAGLGLLLLWRGRSRAALGVALWCFCSVADVLLTSVPVSLRLSAWLSYVGTMVDAVGTLVGLYLVAEVLAAERVHGRWWRWRHDFFYSLLGIYVATLLWYNWQLLISDTPTGLWFLPVFIMHMVVFGIPLGMLLFGYRGVPAANRARIRWVLLSMLGIVAGYLSGIFALPLNLSSAGSNLMNNAFTAAALAGFTYAVLRHRLASLRLVLNRALVYAVITSLVVGVFAAVTSIVERGTLGNGTNRLLELLIPLMLGVGLNAIKRQLDGYINRFLFRHRYKAEAALTDFARTCGFVDDPERLLDLTADEVFRHSGAQALAIYRVQPTSGLVRVRQDGSPEAPARLDANDMALVHLRAGDPEVALAGVSSSLGREGYAFPMMVRGRLMGVLLCGPRPAEQYTADERKLYANVAHQAAVALHTLEMEAERNLLRTLADGGFDSLTAARDRARALLDTQAQV